MKKITLTCVLATLFCYTVTAQISTEEQPRSWEKGISRAAIQLTPVVILPFLDLETLHREDKELEYSYVAAPFRFGYSHEVNLSLTNSGTWTTTLFSVE